jgi:hypothetical protein
LAGSLNHIRSARAESRTRTRTSTSFENSISRSISQNTHILPCPEQGGCRLSFPPLGQSKRLHSSQGWFRSPNCEWASKLRHSDRSLFPLVFIAHGREVLRCWYTTFMRGCCSCQVADCLSRNSWICLRRRFQAAAWGFGVYAPKKFSAKRRITKRKYSSSHLLQVNVKNVENSSIPNTKFAL